MVKAVNAGGLLTPYVKATFDGNGKVHIAYLSNGPRYANDLRYHVNHLVWDTANVVINLEETLAPDPPQPADPSDQGLDNCTFLTMALDSTGQPVIVYQGGTLNACGKPWQSDVMFGAKENSQWSEYIGGKGYVVRNPVFTDGLAGIHASTAVDGDGAVHICYQFYYEGCDRTVRIFPDLFYVKRAANDFASTQIIEETVDEANTYPTFGTGIQNSMGYHCKILLGQDGQPVIFFYGQMADGTKGLRMARKINDQWQCEWVATINQNQRISSISPALKQDSTFAVAYYLEKEGIYGNQIEEGALHFAYQDNGQWLTELVDDGSICGNHCSLSLDSSGAPAIAYYDERAYTTYRNLQDLKFARKTASGWQTETVASQGNIGLYNSIWFDGSNKAHIVSYDQSLAEIVLFAEETR